MNDMDDDRGLTNEMLSNFDHLEDTMDEDHDSNTDLTQTMEYSVDIREITKHHKSQAYKSNITKFRARLQSQLERIRRKRFDSDSSSAEETTLDWLERLQRNRRQRPAIMQRDHSVNDNVEKGKIIREDALQRYTNYQSADFQSTSAYMENDAGMQMERLDVTESESEPTLHLLSRRGDEVSRRGRGNKVEKERQTVGEEKRMVAETLGSLDPSAGDERKGGAGKQIKVSKECELKRVVKVKDQGSRTLRLYQKQEIDQTQSSANEKTIEIVEKKDSFLPQGQKKMHITTPNITAPRKPTCQTQTREILASEGACAEEESEDTDEILSHIQQLYSGKSDQKQAVCFRDNDDQAVMDAGREVDNEDIRHTGKDPANVKMFGKMNGGKRRFAKRAPRRSRLQPTSSSSENDDSKDSLDKMLQKFKALKKEHGESSSSTDAASSLLRRQTVRLMKRFCKRSRENSGADSNGGANRTEDTSNGATTLPSKRARRSTSLDIEVEETVEAHIKKVEKGATYTRRYFQKRHRMKQFSKQRDKKQKIDFSSKRIAVAVEENGPFHPEDADAGPSNIQFDRNSDFESKDERPLFLLNDTPDYNDLQEQQDPRLPSVTIPPRTSLSNSPNTRLSNPPKTVHKGRIIREDKAPSFFLMQKDQRKSHNFFQTKLRTMCAIIIFALLIIAMSFLIRFVFLCNPLSRCWRCNTEFVVYKFIDGHSALRHLKVPPI